MNESVGNAQALRLGSRNLLLHCAGVKPGEQVLLVEEPSDCGFYCPSVTNALAEEAIAMGARVTRNAIDPRVSADELPDDVLAAMAVADHAVFANRVSDYARFMPMSGRCSKTQCYALDADMLAAPACTVAHTLMSELLHRLEAELLTARTWRITCALGTDISGSFCWPSHTGKRDDDFTLSLFPVTTFKPVPCDTANGKVVLSRWLMPGGAPKLEPSTVVFDGPVTVAVGNGRLTDISGQGVGARAVNDYYNRVEAALGVCRERVHSWHAGINPFTRYDQPAGNDLERWGAISFGSPRYLHFHTCGDVAPGEVAWSVFDPTVYVDNEALWRDGQFVWLQRPANRTLIARHPGAEALLAPSASIGT